MKRSIITVGVIACLLFLGASAALAANIRPVPVNLVAPSGEQNLSQIFTAVGGGFESLNPSTDQNPTAYFAPSLTPPATSTFVLRFEYAGSSSGNTFGLYAAGAPSTKIQLFPGSAEAPGSSTGTFTYTSTVAFNTITGQVHVITSEDGGGGNVISNYFTTFGPNFGLYFTTNYSTSPITYYSEDSLNPLGEAHMLAFTTNNEWLFAWENQLFATSDKDYNDMIVTAQSIKPVPEPGTMMLLGSGLVGLAGWGRKKFRK